MKAEWWCSPPVLPPRPILQLGLSLPRACSWRPELSVAADLRRWPGRRGAFTTDSRRAARPPRWHKTLPAELAARMLGREGYHLAVRICRGNFGCGSTGMPRPLSRTVTASVGGHSSSDPNAVAGHRFIHRIIQDLGDEGDAARARRCRRYTFPAAGALGSALQARCPLPNRRLSRVRVLQEIAHVPC